MVIIYRYIYIISFVVVLTLSIPFVYTDYYGFELANLFLHLISVLCLLLMAGRKFNKGIGMIFVIFCIYVIPISIIYHQSTMLNNFLFLSLFFLFVFALPSVGREMSSNVRVQEVIYSAIVICTIIYISLNFMIYVEQGFFLTKESYIYPVSGANTMGYLFYLGATISWFLYDWSGSGKYKWGLVIFSILSILLIPVFTVYLALFVYFLIYSFVAKSVSSRFLVILSIFSLFAILSAYILYNLEEYRVYLSMRDLLYRDSIDLILDKPLLGYGINGWGEITLDIKNPHNFILYSLLSFGILGSCFIVAIFVSYLVSLLITFKKNFKDKKKIKIWKHFFAQYFGHLIFMSGFVAMPGHYQAFSLLLSIYLSLVLNGILILRNQSSDYVQNKRFDAA